jgi:membrane-bound lytic murein transglycosylase D
MPQVDIEFLNPQYSKGVIPVAKDYTSVVILPTDKVGIFINNEDKIYHYLKTDTTAPKAPVLIPTKKVIYYKVRKGDNLGSIANKHKCTVNDIKRWNNKRSSKIYPGNKLKIYVKIYKPAKTVKNTTTKKAKSVIKATTYNKSGKYLIHTIKRGDSIYKIALKYNTTMDNLIRLNNINLKHKLYPGNKLKIKKL